MPSRSTALVILVLAVAGLAMLVFESVRAIDGSVLGTVGTSLLFVGLGLVVVAGLGLIIVMASEPAEPLEPVALNSSISAGTAPTSTPADPATATPGWTELRGARCSGQVSVGADRESVRRGASLVAFREGIEIGVGKTSGRRAWADVAAVTARLGGNDTRVTVCYIDDGITTEAIFSGNPGDLAAVATALVSAAPTGLVEVSYT
jgi:hypothetical protein